VVRYLSPEWFELARQLSSGEDRVPHEPGSRPLVIEQVVRETPWGTVRYQVHAGPAKATIATPGSLAYDPAVVLEIGWQDAIALAQGTLSATRALAENKVRVKRMSAGRAPELSALAGLDPMPPLLRAQTSFT